MYNITQWHLSKAHYLLRQNLVNSILRATVIGKFDAAGGPAVGQRAAGPRLCFVNCQRSMYVRIVIIVCEAIASRELATAQCTCTRITLASPAAPPVITPHCHYVQHKITANTTHNNNNDTRYCRAQRTARTLTAFSLCRTWT